MQHTKAHQILIHATALFACLILSASFFGFVGAAHATAVTSGGNGTGVQGSPTSSGIGQSPSQSASGQTIANPLKYNSLNDLLSAVLKAAIELGSIVLTIAIVWVGFLFVAARGNEEKISRAKSALLWTIIGGLILLGATAIQSVITSTVGAITT